MKSAIRRDRPGILCDLPATGAAYLQAIGALQARPDTLPHAADRGQCGQVLISRHYVAFGRKKAPLRNVLEGLQATLGNPGLCQLCPTVRFSAHDLARAGPCFASM